MKSMTGFGYRELNNDRVNLGINLKSYNNRYLDVVINIPAFLDPLEPLIRDFILARVARGRIEIALKVKEIQQAVNVTLDETAVKAYVTALSKLKQLAGLDEPLRLSHLLRFEGLIKSETDLDSEAYWVMLKPVLEESFVDFEKARIVEGKRTEEFIMNLAGKIKVSVEFIERFVPQIEEKIKASLKKRFVELMGDEIDESRIYAETAVLLIKFDITEEIMRLKSHLENFYEIVEQEESVSKKLDFICQELNREINTIGSKNIMIDVSQAVISVKDQIESIRELLRNVE